MTIDALAANSSTRIDLTEVLKVENADLRLGGRRLYGHQVWVAGGSFISDFACQRFAWLCNTPAERKALSAADHPDGPDTGGVQSLTFSGANNHGRRIDVGPATDDALSANGARNLLLERLSVDCTGGDDKACLLQESHGVTILDSTFRGAGRCIDIGDCTEVFIGRTKFFRTGWPSAFITNSRVTYSGCTWVLMPRPPLASDQGDYSPNWKDTPFLDVRDSLVRLLGQCFVEVRREPEMLGVKIPATLEELTTVGQAEWIKRAAQ